MLKKQSKRNHSDHQVTLEISHSDVAMAIVSGAADSRKLKGHRVKWLDTAASLAKEEAVEELATVLTTLVERERLHGAKVKIALSSDFCVTRVVAGENERVTSELRNLNDRSDQYLLLGAGQKAVAESSRTIDAKQSQAWLTVTNANILKHAVQAVNQAGMQISHIEHDMVAVCRAIGRMRGSDEAPVIVTKMIDRGVVLGVCYDGQLLFDYRPGGVDSKARVGEIVQRHLERIQRYCTRQFRFASGEINTVFVCGSEADVQAVQEQLESCSSGLKAGALNPRDVSPDWEFDEGFLADGHFVAPLGTALLEKAAGTGSDTPNLLEFVLSANRPPLWPELIRAAWPIAASLLLGLLIYGAAVFEHRKGSKLEAEVANFSHQMDLLHSIKLKTAGVDSRLKYLRRIEEKTLNPSWDTLVSWIGQSMPEGVWLDGLRVDQSGLVTITGPGATEDLIFEFVTYLKEIPVLEGVNLEGQQQMNLNGRIVFKFDIKCKFTGQANLAERTASND